MICHNLVGALSEDRGINGKGKVMGGNNLLYSIIVSLIGVFVLTILLTPVPPSYADSPFFTTGSIPEEAGDDVIDE